MPYDLSAFSGRRRKGCAMIRTVLCPLLFALWPAARLLAGTFTNPVIANGADPWVLYLNGYYYFTDTTGRVIAA